MKPLRCVIVDDEPLAREGLASYVQEVDFLHLTTTCQHPLELMQLLDQKPVDVLFLDIQMPKMSGIDFLKVVKQPPLVILTTAYPSYAVEGFQLNVLDYLLKPITFERFLAAAQKAKDYHRLLEQADQSETAKAVSNDDYFFIKCGNKFEKLLYDEILFVEGMQNYVTFYTTRGKFITLLTLKDLEQNLASHSFLRVHKSYVVSIPKIEGIEGNELFIQTHRIPISRTVRDQVLHTLLSDKLWKK